MRTLLAIFFLLLPSILLWIKWYHEYTEKLLDTAERRICLILLGSYIVVIAVFGAESVEGIEDRMPGSDYFKSFLSCYAYPGIGFAIVLFPKVAAEFTRHYLPLARANLLGLFSVFGWFILVISALWGVIVHG